MFDFIENLRHKPLAYRKRVLLLVTTVITGLIILIWLSTLNFNSSIGDMDGTVIEEQLKPIGEIKKSAVSFFDSVKKMSADIFGY